MRAPRSAPARPCSGPEGGPADAPSHAGWQTTAPSHRVRPLPRHPRRRRHVPGPDHQLRLLHLHRCGRPGGDDREIHRLNPRTTTGARSADLIKDLTERIGATFVYAGIDVTTTPLFTGVRGAQLAARASLIDCAAFPTRLGDQEPFRNLITAMESALDLRHHRPGTLPQLAPTSTNTPPAASAASPASSARPPSPPSSTAPNASPKPPLLSSASATSPNSTTNPAPGPGARMPAPRDPDRRHDPWLGRSRPCTARRPHHKGMAAAPVSRAGRAPRTATDRRSNRLIYATPCQRLPAGAAPAPGRHRHHPPPSRHPASSRTPPQPQRGPAPSRPDPHPAPPPDARPVPPRPTGRRPPHRSRRTLEAAGGRAAARPRLHPVHPTPQPQRHRHHLGLSAATPADVPAPPPDRSRPASHHHHPHLGRARTSRRTPRTPTTPTTPPDYHHLDHRTRHHHPLARPPAPPHPPLAHPPPPALRDQPPAAPPPRSSHATW